MFTVRLLLLLQIATTIPLGACSSDDKKPEEKAMVAGASAISSEGRDPFGGEAAAAAANGQVIDDDDDGGVPCPNFSLGIVGPFVQLIGEESTFSAHAQDDHDHEFLFTWSASGGELSKKTGQRTTYTCSEPGVQTITMTASLRTVCTSAIAQVVTCLKPNE